MLLYRLVLPEHAAMAFSGEGARRFGGRWNPKGCPAAVGPEESNILINPLHPQAKTMEILEPKPFRFDSRLLWGDSEH